MVVTSGASNCQSEEDAAGCVDAVLGVDGIELFGDDAALIRRDVAAIKAGSDQLIHGSIREQIARDLFKGEPIERHVAIERADDPIANGHMAR